ncbi:membrane protein insertion efficiency factor YidD [Oceaniovalibus sp. ACAM 378]|uniref:membrane protein insertion efficiency factor YidD n=1 Tax=Oceaniovalibus sp. ACAM 378 TaxID=2599923 RepID=UPI0011D78DD9|nr:membrane protein insertion efficiency factor YidD [Oceaniovalibus sp. ACAM 378]TYB89182.1 membrane protein insertion efficiency factor YidD [Oceaniovalibus sp. ACAM 378]
MFEDDANVELDLPENMIPRALRGLGITPAFDRLIDDLSEPDGFFARAAYRFCRGYRRIRPDAVGNRCAFDPSCSRYCEIMFRYHSAPLALGLTIKRLYSCTAANGGFDLPDDIKARLKG